MESIQEKLARLKATMAATSTVTPTPAPVVTTIPAPIAPIAPAAKLNPAQEKLQKLLAARKLLATPPATPELSPIAAAVLDVVTEISNTRENNTPLTSVDKYGNTISYNEEQLEFIQTAVKGDSCILIGAAGTGKTTCMRGAISELIASNIVPANISTDGHKTLPITTYGIVCVSFTRRAVANLRRAMSEELKNNCLTIHALLEYEPVYHDVLDPETGETKTTMNFEPTRTAHRPLPAGIKVCVIDEASMVSVELFNELQAALPSDCQFIFLGDIQQLPPVFGAAILGFKMLELKTVELKQVYRQALESPIIRLAHRILSGKPIPVTEYPEWKFEGQLTIHPWKKKLDSDTALITLAKFLTTAIASKLYSPEEDMVLIPFNKACGTIELNKHIANYIAKTKKLVTWEIIAGFNKHYLSVGDKILFDKEDGIVIDIKPNPTYTGVTPIQESVSLDYWGCYQLDEGQELEHHIDDVDADDEIEAILAMSAGSDEDRVRKSSHIVTVKLLDTNREVVIDTAAGMNSLLLSYALTVHKSQGSEFRKVFFLLHQSHNTMLQRELMYTAVTRAREELYVICEPESFSKGITSQRIKGNTLAEKAEFFKGKLEQASQ